jgi:hypothetical protein
VVILAIVRAQFNAGDVVMFDDLVSRNVSTDLVVRWQNLEMVAGFAEFGRACWSADDGDKTFWRNCILFSLSVGGRCTMMDRHDHAY